MHRILLLQGELKDKCTPVNYDKKVSTHIFSKFTKC